MQDPIFHFRGESQRLHYSMQIECDTRFFLIVFVLNGCVQGSHNVCDTMLAIIFQMKIFWRI